MSSDIRIEILLLLKKLKFLLSRFGINLPSQLEPLLLSFRAFFHSSTPSIIQVDGLTIKGLMKDTGFFSHLAASKLYEPWETMIYKESLKKGMTVIDVGANIGYYTLIAARQVGSRGRVYSFEPEPANYSFLNDNIALNNFTNVVTNCIAISDKQHSVLLYLDKFNLADHAMSRANIYKSSGSPISVQTDTLDNYLKTTGQKQIDVIKTDTQGADGLVLFGAKNILRNKKIRIFLEFWPYGLRNLGTNPQQLYFWLTTMGFKIHMINEDTRRLESKTFQQIMTLCDEGYYNFKGKGYVNLYLHR